MILKKWYIQENVTSIAIKQETKSRTRQDACVCVLSKSSHLKDENKNNAKLIAMAPEMLAVLIEFLNNSDDDGYWAANIDQLRHKAMNIISKTKGEE